jgi:hypothetical protein
MALAFVLRRLTVLTAIIAMWQRGLLRRVHGTEWRLEGRCQSCGRCCENLLLPLGSRSSARAVVWIRRFWHEAVNDFYPKPLVLESDEGALQPYGCRNFTADRKCSRYALRPFVCRAYPALALLDRPQPRAHCGYKVRLPVVP